MPVEKPVPKRCGFTHANGRACGSWAQRDSEWCFLHNPDGRYERQVARTKRMNAEGRMS